MGDFLSLLSAIFYGAYAVTLKKRIPPELEDTFNFSYFLGFVGLFNVLFILPLFPVLHFLKIETFEWPGQ
jgi:solute carrier family 35 protein F5